MTSSTTDVAQGTSSVAPDDARHGRAEVQTAPLPAVTKRPVSSDTPPLEGLDTAPPPPPNELAAGDAGRFARIIRMTRDLLGVESVGIEILDHRRRWSASGYGIAAFDSAILHGLCDETAELGEMLVLDDVTAHADGATLLDAEVRFFAAHPLARTGVGNTGVLWVASREPRTFGAMDRDRFADLARWVGDEAVDAEEMTRSRLVQQALLPKSFDTLDGYEVAGASSPKRAVGGDFYDWYPVQDGAAFTLGDVMGKGVPAALIATTVRAVMRAGSRWGGVAAAAEAAEDALDADLSGASMFVTLFHAYLDEETGMVRYIDAGHGLSLVVHEDGTSERLFSNAVPLGAGGNLQWRTETVRLVPGSTLVSFTDGLLDVYDGTLGAIGEVEAIVRRAPSAKSIVDTLLSLVDTAVTDDVTVIVIRRTSTESDWD